MSLKWKSALYLFLCALILIPVTFEFTLSAFATQQAQNQLKEDEILLGHIANIATDVLLSSSSDLADRQSLEKIVQTFSHYKNIPHYKAFTLNQKDIVVLSTVEDLDRLKNSGYQTLSKLMIPELQVSLEMYVDSDIDKQKFYSLKNYNPLIIITLILIFTLIGYQLASSTSQKLEGLVVGISKAGGGNYNQRMEVSGDDELTQLSLSYNRMLDNLQLTSQEIREQLKSFREILELTPIGIITYNERGIIESFNRSVAGIFETSAAGVIGTNINQLIPASIEFDNGEIQSQALDVFDDKVQTSSELLAVRHNSDYFPIKITITKTSITNNIVFTAVIKDISEKKRLIAAHQKLEDELLSLQRKNTFTQHSESIVHELNNIIGPILGYADLALVDSEEDSLQYKYINHILEGANRATILIQQIARFTKSENLNMEQFHLKPLVKDVLPLIKSTLSSKYNIDAHYISANDVVTADKTRLAQLLLMLIDFAKADNAAHILSIVVDNYSDESNNFVRIKIEFHHNVREGEIEQDSEQEDKLIPENELDNDFLTIRDLAQSMQCELLIFDAGDESRRYSILLPSNKDEKESVTGLKRILAKNRENILYVDDDLASAELGQELLESIGYHVDIETKSQKALEIIKKNPTKYKLIVTDQSMPEMMGTELAMEIKKLNLELPVILVTGFSSSVRESDLEASGVEYCVAKPIVIDEFGELLVKVLSGN